MQSDSLSLNKIVHYFKIAVTGKQKEFTSGSIRRAIFMLAVPMILEMLMESIFALVDIMYVSQISVNAVATIGLTESVITLIYAVAIGLSIAATAIVARRVGAKDIKGATDAAIQVIFLGVFVAIIISVIGLLYPRDILKIMGGSPDLIEEGFGYTKVLLGGNMTIMLLFLINAIFRGTGEASISMWTLILSNGLNIILDPIFIFGLGPIPAFGVEGAAIATTIGRGTAVLFQLGVFFFGFSKIKIGLRDIVIRIGVMFHLIKVSLGGIGQFFIGTSSWVFLMRIMSEFGSEVLAGYTIAIRVMLFSLMPAWGMSSAAATLVGQNLGANKSDRAEQSVWKTSTYCAFFMGIVSIIYLVFAPQIIELFNKTDAVISSGSLCLRIMTAPFVFYGFGMIVLNAFNGAGDTKTPTYINFVCFWLIQLPFAYLAAITLNYGPVGVFSAIAIGEVLMTIIAVIWFKKGQWKKVEV